MLRIRAGSFQFPARSYKGGIGCTRREWNSDYRAVCWNCAARKSSCPPRLLEDISVGAQLRLQQRKPPIDGNFLVDMTVRAAERALVSQLAGTRQQIEPFFTELNRVMYYTLCHVAEHAGLAYREPGKLRTNLDFWDEFCNRALDVKVNPRHSVAKLQKSLFKVCHEIVKERFARMDLDNARFADLAALFMFNFWNANGLLPMTQAVVILGSKL